MSTAQPYRSRNIAEISWNFIRYYTRANNKSDDDHDDDDNGHKSRDPYREAGIFHLPYFYDPLPPSPPTIIILRGSPRLLSKSRTSAVESDSPLPPPPPLPLRVACEASSRRCPAHLGIRGLIVRCLPAIPPRASVHTGPGCARITKWILAEANCDPDHSCGFKRRSHRFNWV